jgi:hypothetical protein
LSDNIIKTHFSAEELNQWNKFIDSLKFSFTIKIRICNMKGESGKEDLIVDISRKLSSLGKVLKSRKMDN